MVLTAAAKQVTPPDHTWGPCSREAVEPSGVACRLRWGGASLSTGNGWTRGLPLAPCLAPWSGSQAPLTCGAGSAAPSLRGQPGPCFQTSRFPDCPGRSLTLAEEGRLTAPGTGVTAELWSSSCTSCSSYPGRSTRRPAGRWRVRAGGVRDGCARRAAALGVAGATALVGGRRPSVRAPWACVWAAGPPGGQPHGRMSPGSQRGLEAVRWVQGWASSPSVPPWCP